MRSPPGRITDFSEPRKLLPDPPLPRGLSPSVTILGGIKSWNKSGLPSEGSDITVVVSSVADNLERVI